MRFFILLCILLLGASVSQARPFDPDPSTVPANISSNVVVEWTSEKSIRPRKSARIPSQQRLCRHSGTRRVFGVRNNRKLAESFVEVRGHKAFNRHPKRRIMRIGAGCVEPPVSEDEDYLR